MNIFILSTGRSATMTFIKACKHITNYSSGHESRSREIGPKKLAYRNNHIEADNRLCWQLGKLHKSYGNNNTLYVHLIRDIQKTASSFEKRFFKRYSIINSYSEGVLKTHVSRLSSEQKKQICIDYVNLINANIEHFLIDKNQKMTIEVEHIRSHFQEFWKRIHAEGDLADALAEFDTKHNASKTTSLSFAKTKGLLKDFLNNPPRNWLQLTRKLI